MTKQSGEAICSGATPRQIEEDLKPLLDFQKQGLSMEELRTLIEDRLVPHLVKYDHPGFHSLYNFVPEETAAMGARIALTYNQGVTNWQVSPGGVMVEELCCRALCRMFGLSPGADATFMYSGSYASQQAGFMALHGGAERRGFDLAQDGLPGIPEPGRFVVLASEEAHFSLRQAVRMLGLGEKALVSVPADGKRRLDIQSLEKTISALRGSKDIFCIVVTAGTASTGSIDPIRPIVELAKDVGAWVHVDGAYGFAYRMLAEYESVFAGVELADSVTWDPHKQFGVPIPSSILFARRGEDFQRMALFSGYFNREGETVPNPGLKSAPSTRPFSALPLVTTLRCQGMEKAMERLRTPLTAVRAFVDALQAEEDIELMLEPDLGIACLRLTPRGIGKDLLDPLQQYLYERTMAEGKRSISMTSIGGKTVLRFLVVSPTVSSETLMETIAYLRTLVAGFNG